MPARPFLLPAFLRALDRIPHSLAIALNELVG